MKTADPIRPQPSQSGCKRAARRRRNSPGGRRAQPGEARPGSASPVPALAESAKRKARVEAWLQQPVKFLASRI